MDTDHWYGVALGGIALLLCLQTLLRLALARMKPWVQRRIQPAIVAVIQTSITRSWRVNWGLSPLHIVIILLLFSANIVVLLIFNDGLQHVRQRAAILSLINCCFLPFTGRTSFLSNLLGFSTQMTLVAHRWLGRIAFLLAAIHIGTALKYQPTLDGGIWSGSVVSKCKPEASGFTNIIIGCYWAPCLDICLCAPFTEIFVLIFGLPRLRCSCSSRGHLVASYRCQVDLTCCQRHKYHDSISVDCGSCVLDRLLGSQKEVPKRNSDRYGA